MSVLSDDFRSLLVELQTRVITPILKFISIKPLATIVLNYAGLDQYGIFMEVASIRMQPVYVIPIGTEYSIRFGVRKKKIEIVVRQIGDPRKLSAVAYKRKLEDQNIYGVSYIYDSKSMFQLVVNNNAVAIGDLLKRDLHKKWWKREQTEKVGRACIDGLILKAKLMLQRQLCPAGKRSLPIKK